VFVVVLLLYCCFTTDW